MYRFLIITLLCVGAVLAQAYHLQADTGTGKQETSMQYHRRFDFNQEQASQELLQEQGVDQQDASMAIVEDEMQDADEQGGMTIIFAYYGLSCANGNIQQSNQDRSTNFARSKCNGRSSCSGRIHVSVLTDPYGGCQKDFLVVAKCPNGKIISSLVRKEANGRYFSLKCC